MTPYPNINGVRYDWSCIKISLDGKVYGGVKGMTYKQTMTPGMIRGTYSQVTGRTRGQYEADGTIEFYKEDYHDFILALSANGTRGYMETAFTAMAQYSSGGLLAPGIAIPGVSGLSVITDTCVGCRLSSDEDNHSESPDGLTVTCDLSIMYILKNGLSALSPDQLLR